MTLLRPHSQRVNTILSADIWEKNIQHTMFIIRICKNLYQVQLLFTKCVTITLKLWLWRLSKPVRFTFYKTDGTWKQRQAQPLQRILLRTHTPGQGRASVNLSPAVQTVQPRSVLPLRVNIILFLNIIQFLKPLISEIQGISYSLDLLCIFANGKAPDFWNWATATTGGMRSEDDDRSEMALCTCTENSSANSICTPET